MGSNSLTILTAPLRAEEIEWRILTVRGGTTVIAPYITARAVMSRLDAAFGPWGWQVRYTPAQIGEQWGVIASIAIRSPDGEWVAKEDGAGATDMEPYKGAISGALKRAATAWGIGRELYGYPRIIIDGEHQYIPTAVLRRLEGLPAAVAEGKPLPERIKLAPDGTYLRGAEPVRR